jgi:4-hydroxy-3-polyprenylbenzoate decarboxylase
LAYRDIGEFAALLEKKGLLKRIKSPVSPILEITEITDRVVKMGGPALLFENVEGSPYPVLINTFGTEERMCLALGVEKLHDIGAEIKDFLKPPEVTGFWDKLKALPKLAEVGNWLPKTVNQAPCQKVVEEPDLDRLPVLKCWPEDGGRYITLPLVFTNDPETGRRNVGMYRLQVFDARTTGMHWHVHKDGADHYARTKGKRLEVAVAIGADPTVIYAATAPLPKGIDELLFAGFLRKSPVEVVKAKTVDIMVPAHAEFILEGYVEVGETRLEGPFGDHTGYYSLADNYPVFHVTCVTRKKAPIYPTIIVGKPVQEDCFLGKATERIFLPIMQVILPEIVDVNLPFEGGFHNCVLVSIKKAYPGHAKKVMTALWGLGMMMLSKLIVVVDNDTDVQNQAEVAWRVLNNTDPGRDVMVVEGPLDALDHSSPLPHYGAKMGVDATRKWPSEGHTREWPGDIVMDREIVEKVDRKWREYGLG